MEFPCVAINYHKSCLLLLFFLTVHFSLSFFELYFVLQGTSLLSIPALMLSSPKSFPVNVVMIIVKELVIGTATDKSGK